MKRPSRSIVVLLVVLALVAFAVSRCIRVEYVAVVPPGVEDELVIADAPEDPDSAEENVEDPSRFKDSPPVLPGFSFHLVAEDSDARARALVSSTDGVAPDGFLATEDDYGFVRDASRGVDPARLRAFGDPPAGQICLMERKAGKLFAPVFVEDPPVHRQLAAVRSCGAETDPITDRILVSVVLGKRDAAAFAKITAANARTADSPGRRLAIVLGDAVVMDALLLEPIRDGRFVLSSCDSRSDAETLAHIISSADPDADAAPGPFVWDLLGPNAPATPSPTEEIHAESAENSENANP
jgi:hypothetical protein